MQVIIKGLKGDYMPTLEWLKELYTLSSQLSTLLTKEPDAPGAAVQVLDIIKAGLYSRCGEVSLWTCRLLARLADDLNGKGLGGIAWEWFIAENGGLSGLLHCYMKNHHLVAESAISVMCQYGRYNFVELFTHYVKNSFKTPGEYLQTVAVFLQPLSEYRAAREEIISGGALDIWAEMGCQKAGPENPDVQERSAALNMLVELWLCFSGKIEEKADFADRIIKLLQRANRDRAYNMQMLSLGLQFKLLDLFAIERDPYAPIVYKTLTFSLVESLPDDGVREFMLGNFRLILDNFSTIPICILLDPFIKAVSSVNQKRTIDTEHRRNLVLLQPVRLRVLRGGGPASATHCPECSPDP